MFEATAIENICNYFQSSFVEVDYYGLFILLLPFGASVFLLYKSSRHYLKYKKLKQERIETPEDPKGYDELSQQISNEIDYIKISLTFGCFFFFISIIFLFDYSPKKYTCIDNILYISDDYEFEPSKDYKKCLCTTQKKMEEYIKKDEVIYVLMKSHGLFKVPVIDAVTNQPIFLGKNIKVNRFE